MSNKYNIHPYEKLFQEWDKNRPDNPVNKILSSPLIYNENVKESKPWELNPRGWKEEYY